MRKFYTSDTHFGHQRILEFCPSTRPFANTVDMDEKIISNWNSKVAKNDIVYHLGDWSFTNNFSFLDRLNGKIVAIRGNHDQKIFKERSDRFESIHDILNVKDNGHHIVLCHYRFYEWYNIRRGYLHFHGHSHNNVPSTKQAIDVGMDNPSWDISPVCLDEILLESKNYPDHPPI